MIDRFIARFNKDEIAVFISDIVIVEGLCNKFFEFSIDSTKASTKSGAYLEVSTASISTIFSLNILVLSFKLL